MGSPDLKMLARALGSRVAPESREDLVTLSNGGGLLSRIPQNIREKFGIPEDNRPMGQLDWLIPKTHTLGWKPEQPPRR